MKKLTLFSLVLFLCTEVYSQTVWLGGGMTQSTTPIVYTTLFGVEVERYKSPLTAPAFSAGIEILDGKTFSINPSLHYFKAGAQFSEEEISGYGPTPPAWLVREVWFTYISGEVLAGLNTYSKGKNFKIQLLAGPRFDFMLKNNLKAHRLTGNKVDLNKLNFGATVGLGTYYLAGRFQFGLKGLYFHQLNSILEADFGETVTIEGNPMLFNFSVGYSLSKE